MRQLIFAAALAVSIPLAFPPAPVSAQGLPGCDGLKRSADGIQATLGAKKDTNTSGLTEVTLSVTLKDTAGGRTIASPKVKTTMGKPAEVTMGEAGKPGSLKLKFSPNAMGGASTVNVDFIGADGKGKHMSLSCSL